MIDATSHSKELRHSMQSFVSNDSERGSSLDAMLITNQNSTHCNNDELTDDDGHCTQRESDLLNLK